MKLLIIISLLCFTLLLGFYKIYYSNNNLVLNNGINIDMINSEIYNSIPACNIAKPVLHNKFTYSFWFYINDFYNYNLKLKTWKHIFHKGTFIKNNPPNKFLNWNSVIKEIPEQSVGVWLDPELNNIRVAINVNNSLEYTDIKNIPIKKLVNITITISDSFMEIYMNGQNYLTKLFSDSITFNNIDMYFNYQYTYNGKLFNFLYVPKLLNFNEIKQIYQNKPNLNSQ